MALDYHKCAQEIVDTIGGRPNVVSAAHCATRLRLVTVDNSKVNKKKLEDIDGVKGVFESNGQLQIIIGTGTVNKVYDEFLAITGMTAATKDDVKAAAVANAPLWRRLIKALGDVFVPILPAIVASGLMMGMVEALGKAIPSFSQTDWYAFLDMVSNTAFAYLPVIVAVSAARVFGGNIFLGAVIGLLMIHSSLTNGWNAADGYGVWYLFGHIKIGSYTLGQINQLGYQGHVIPVIIAIYIMCHIEKWLHKHVIEMLDLFVTPLCTVLSTALLTFTIIGPIFSSLESFVLHWAEILVQNPIGALVMGAVYPCTVVMGLHHMYNVIEAGMLASVGLNTWMPIASAANFAQFGACLAVGLKAKNNKTKVVAVPSSMSAALGITEPAIFGVNMRFFKPFVCGMIGGAIGALFGAISRIGATAYGVTGIPGYLTITNPLVYTILLAISGGIAFVLTWFVWKEEVPEEVAAEKAVEEERELKEEEEEEETEAFDQAPVISTSKGKIYAPAKGKIIPASEIPDDTFAQGILGATAAVWPENGRVVAPFDGTVTFIAETKHAINLEGPNGEEVLIHVGVDTVKMDGDGFEPSVREDQQVKKGDLLLKFDRDKVKAAGHPDCVVVVLSDPDEYEDVKAGPEAAE
ncbi:PTS beta-glucoside transporter subunit IIBCA [Clostridium vitabionis]|jgi:glucose-specific phosphotransferase system IIA component|uniref:PTS beta-glucoside transporter subunit IIBCA n=1 Tax=Clostridium vitabionis TaxID=2784388 RepID=UPI00188A5B61|nr:PTS transporter subunit IIBCA [Clostridium vitabionis]